MEKATVLLAVPLAQLQGENSSEIVDGEVPVNVEVSVAYTLKD